MIIVAIIGGVFALAFLGLVVWFVGVERAANRNDNKP